MKTVLTIFLLTASVVCFGQLSGTTAIRPIEFQIPSPYLTDEQILEIYYWKKEQAIRECVHQFSMEVLRKRNSGELEIIDSFTPESSWIEYLELLKFKESDGTLVIMVAKGTPYVFKMHGLYYFLWKRAGSPGDYYHNEVKNEKKFLIATLCEESGN